MEEELLEFFNSRDISQEIVDRLKEDKVNCVISFYINLFLIKSCCHATHEFVPNVFVIDPFLLDKHKCHCNYD